jgi:hypothetical protein
MAYVTLDEFKRSPVHGIDWNTLDDSDDPIEDENALQTILDVAEAWVNAHEYVGVDTLETATHTERVVAYLDRNGEITIRPRNFPLNSVTSVKYRTSPRSDWTTLDVDQDVETLTNRFIIKGDGCVSFAAPLHDLVGYSGFNYGYRSPHDMNALRRIPITVEFTYEAGYATIPPNVKQAVIFYAASMIKRRGSASISYDGETQASIPGPSRQADVEVAESLLKSLRRVV